ncbi:hypothetical protein [Clostridium sp. ZBS14]|uniref:hypothetical protein n=1 Tax=Clostridium sp. ZBS14 TaxID=2949970 RepID=UPI002079C730|nr:hypothetical protein [Clostridium sp. ZBS14]
MYKYIIKVPLKYNNESKLDKYGFNNSICYTLKEDIKCKYILKLNKGQYSAEEELLITIQKQDDHNMILKFDSIYADDREWAIKLAVNIIDNICYAISFIVQQKNSNTHYFDTKFGYNIKDVEIMEDKYSKYEEYMEENLISFNESLRLRESLSMKGKQVIDINSIDFNKILNEISKDNKKRHLIECYYKSLGNIEYTSKYYNLFTIIEFIETNYTKEISINNIFTEEEEKEILDNMRILLAENLNKDNEIVNRIINRVSQITNSSLETRAEKLYRIITEYFAIECVNSGVHSIELTKAKVNEFIKMRNGLFHAKSISEEQKNCFNILTEELMILCGEIISKLI